MQSLDCLVSCHFVFFRRLLCMLTYFDSQQLPSNWLAVGLSAIGLSNRGKHLQHLEVDNSLWKTSTLTCNERLRSCRNPSIEGCTACLVGKHKRLFWLQLSPRLRSLPGILHGHSIYVRSSMRILSRSRSSGSHGELLARAIALCISRKVHVKYRLHAQAGRGGRAPNICSKYMCGYHLSHERVFHPTRRSEVVVFRLIRLVYWRMWTLVMSSTGYAHNIQGFSANSASQVLTTVLASHRSLYDMHFCMRTIILAIQWLRVTIGSYIT